MTLQSATGQLRCVLEREAVQISLLPLLQSSHTSFSESVEDV